MSKKRNFLQKYTFAAGFFLLFIISALVLSWFDQEQKPDPASEKVIRIFASIGSGKEPNELTGNDFAGMEKLYINFGETLVFTPIIPAIHDIRLSGLPDIIPLEKFTNLRELQIISTPYPEEKIPKWMKILDRFGAINIKDRYYIDLKPIENLTNLTSLTFLSSDIKNIESLSNIKNLESLDLSYTQVYDLKPLSKLNNLKILHIRKTKVSNLKPLRRLHNLETLNIVGCEKITDEQVEDLQRALPELNIYR